MRDPAPVRPSRAARRPRRGPAAVVLAGTLLLSSCAAPPSAAPDPADTVTVSSCGTEVEVPRDPERVMLLKSAPVPLLAELGLLDRVVAKAGAYPLHAYDPTTRAQLEQIPTVGGDVDASGHLQISQEAVLGEQPDLVLGRSETLDVAGLQRAGIPVLEEPGLCPGAQGPQSFADVDERLRTYGEVFGRSAEAEEAIAEQHRRLDGLEQRAARGRDGADAPRTAAVLYPTVGGGSTYAYGADSMAAPVLAAAGLEDVFAHEPGRVFEVSPEELVGRDPDVLILLHADGDPDAVAESLAQIPGADRLTAVVQDEVLVLPMNHIEPATPQSLDGLAAIVERFDP